MLGQDQRHFRKAVRLHENGPDVYCCHCAEGSTVPPGDAKKPTTQELEASLGHNAGGNRLRTGEAPKPWCRKGSRGVGRGAGLRAYLKAGGYILKVSAITMSR